MPQLVDYSQMPLAKVRAELARLNAELANATAQRDQAVAVIPQWDAYINATQHSVAEAATVAYGVPVMPPTATPVADPTTDPGLEALVAGGFTVNGQPASATATPAAAPRSGVMQSAVTAGRQMRDRVINRRPRSTEFGDQFLSLFVALGAGLVIYVVFSVCFQWNIWLVITMIIGGAILIGSFVKRHLGRRPRSATSNLD